MSDDRTLGRIAGLLRKAESTDNEHERDACMQTAQRLATMASVDLAVARAADPARRSRATPIHRQVVIGPAGKRGLYTYVRLFLEVALANDLRCDIAHNSTYVIAYGFPDDIEAVETLYASLVVQMVRAGEAYLQAGSFRDEFVWRRVTRTDGRGRRRSDYDWAPVPPTTARTSFHEAFARRVGERLTEAAARAKADAVAAEEAARAAVGPDDEGATTGPAVANRPAGPLPATTNTALVLRAKDDELDAYHREHSRARGAWRGGRGPAGHSPDADRAGTAAGSRARLGAEPEIGGSRRALGA